MDKPTMLPSRTVAAGIESLPSYTPIPGLGLLPVNAFLIRATDPVLVDTGLFALQADFMQRLRSLIDPAALKWIWLTHVDPDHVGSLFQVLDEAPNARVVTTFLGMGKMGVTLTPLPPDRAYLLNPGQTLNVGDRELLALKPPTFDAPETTALFDTRSRALISSDSFGGLMPDLIETAHDVSLQVLRDGIVTWTSVDSPWIHCVDPKILERILGDIADLQPTTILSSHLPPADDLTPELLGFIAEVRESKPFVGPDQQALLEMFASAS